MAKQNNKSQKHSSFIFFILIAFGIAFFVMSILAVGVLVALNPVKRFNDAKIANCEAKFNGDQEKILSCFKETQVMISPTP